MQADFPATVELEEEVRREANDWKTLSFTKKSKITDFWSKAIQKKKSKSDKRLTPNYKSKNNKSDILVRLCRKRDVGQLSQSDLKEITSREATLRKCKANLKQKEASRKRQQKFRVYQKRKKIQEIEEQTGAKLSKKSQKEEKHVHNE